MLYLIRFLLRNLRGYRLLLLIAVVMSVLLVFSNIMLSLPAKFIGDIIQGHIDPKATIIPGAIQDVVISIFDNGQHEPGLHHSVLGVILASVFILILFSILSAIVTYVQLYLVAFLAQNLSARLRKHLFEHLQRLSLDWHGKHKKGDIVQRVTGNIADIEKFMSDGLVDMLSGVLTVMGVASVMLLTSLQFSILSIVIIPALAVVTFSYTRSIKAAAKKTSRAVGEVADVAVEDVGAITVLKAFSLEEREAGRFGKYAEQARAEGLRAGGLQAQLNPVVTILVAIGTAIILGAGSYVAAGKDFNFIIFIPKNSLTLGTVFQFITLIGMLFQPLKDFSKSTTVASTASAGAERIQEVLDQAPEVLENKVPYNGPVNFRGDITFENVLFGYTPEKLILKGINLHIPAGKKVALVGLSGGGKTTLVKLIPRFYEPTQGSVKIDGIDNRMIPLAVVRRNVGMVLQESVLFEGTVLDNLKIGRPEATMEEVINAAKQAQIHDVIMSFPAGYNTQVRNQGKNFSGGQRQRMAIARAILSKAPILILDEPTASLDVEAEAEVMRALDQLVLGRTVLMISHRLSTLGKVDQIIVLKDGKITEQGTYLELKRLNGEFARLLKEQNRYNVDYVGESIVASRFAGEAAGPVQQPVPQQIPAGQQNWLPVGNNVVPPVQGVGIAGQNGGREMSNPRQRSQAQKASVVIEIDGSIVGEKPLTKPMLTVGRLSSNDIPVRVDRVSRLHARIRWENGEWLIEDADSLNGISYQGTRVDQHILSNGDRVLLAPKVALYFKAG